MSRSNAIHYFMLSSTHNSNKKPRIKHLGGRNMEVNRTDQMAPREGYFLEAEQATNQQMNIQR